MRIYQTIHKYAKHIPLFEERYGIHDHSGHSFKQLQQLILEDGYASAYVLQPAIEGKTDEVFFTIWNYERLQLSWAQEHGLETTDLSKIKKAQIDWYKPDVFYDFSAMLDVDFLEKYPIDKQIIKVCWYGIIQKEPLLFKNYDIRISLHKPYCSYWKNANLLSYEMQPAIDSRWNNYNAKEKDIDILYYGQYNAGMFRNRSKLVDKLLLFAEKNQGLNIKVHIPIPADSIIRKKIYIFRLPFYKENFPPQVVKQLAQEPLYGEQLYQTIGNSKFVLNAYTNYNKEFKSNMRLFEAVGCGSLLISEKGHYPKGFVPNKSFIPYDIKHASALFNQFEHLILNYKMHHNEMQESYAFLRNHYSKEAQYQQFLEIVTSFKQS